MNELNGHDIEDLKVGMTATFAKTITEADIVLFAGASGDNNAMHINEEFAATTPFKGRIAHGMLSASVISAAIANKLPGPGHDLHEAEPGVQGAGAGRRHRACESLGARDVAGEEAGVPRHRVHGARRRSSSPAKRGEGRLPRMTTAVRAEDRAAAREGSRQSEEAPLTTTNGTATAREAPEMVSRTRSTALHRIVIVGGGAGGLELATRLGDKLGKGKKAHVTLIEKKRNHFWKPHLHEIAAGSMDIGVYQTNYLAQAHWHISATGSAR